MPVIMQANKTTISMLAINVNRQFNYDRYFSMVPGGHEGMLAFSRGFFELAAAQTAEARRPSRWSRRMPNSPRPPADGAQGKRQEARLQDRL